MFLFFREHNFRRYNFSQFVNSANAHFHLWHIQMTQMKKEYKFPWYSRTIRRLFFVFFVFCFNYFICWFRCSDIICISKATRFAKIMSSSNELVYSNHGQMKEEKKIHPKWNQLCCENTKHWNVKKRRKKMDMENTIILTTLNNLEMDIWSSVCLPRTRYTTGKWIQ